MEHDKTESIYISIFNAPKEEVLKNRKISQTDCSLFNDVMEAVNNVSETISITEKNELEFDEIIEFNDSTIPSFPINALSTTICDMVIAVANFTQTPIDLAAIVVQGTLSTALAKKFKVQPKLGWIENVNTYTMPLMDSANRKSAAVDYMNKPILEKQKSLAEMMAPEVVKRKHERLALEKRIEKLQSDYAKSKDPEIKEEIKETVDELENLPELFIPSLVLDNFTEEILITRLTENDEKIAILSAEGDLIERLKAMGPESSKKDVYLKGYNGEYLRVDRVMRGIEILYEPLLTVCISAQPTIIKNMSDSMKERGLIPRFLFSIPDDFKGYRDPNSPPVPKLIEDQYTTLINKLLDFSPREPIVLQFAEDAFEEFTIFQLELEKEFRSGGVFDSELRSWGGKLAGQLVRLAGLLHITTHIETAADIEDIPTKITKETLIRILQLKDYFICHAEKAFGIMRLNRSIEDAKLVLNKIQATGSLTLSKQDVWQKTKTTFEIMERLDSALRILESRSYIQRSFGGKSGRKVFINVNPMLYNRRSS